MFNYLYSITKSQLKVKSYLTSLNINIKHKHKICLYSLLEKFHQKMNDEQRELIVKIYYEKNRSVTLTYRALGRIFGRHKRPSKSTISSCVKTYEKYGAIRNPNKPIRRKTVRTCDLTAAMIKDVQENPVRSLQQRSKEFGISVGTVRRILTNYLDGNSRVVKLKPYIIKKITKLTTEQMEIIEHVKNVNNLSEEKWKKIVRLAKNQNDRNG